MWRIKGIGFLLLEGQNMLDFRHGVELLGISRIPVSGMVAGLNSMDYWENWGLFWLYSRSCVCSQCGLGGEYGFWV